jgi:hypothetical protein
MGFIEEVQKEVFSGHFSYSSNYYSRSGSKVAARGKKARQG